MTLKLGINTNSLAAQRNLDKASLRLSAVYERLASGLRINKSADDPGGLAIAKNLQAAARVYSQAVRNINDSVSMFSLADDALAELSSILARQKELAVQAANGTMNLNQKKVLQAEADALTEEYNRILETTEYNGQRLFSDSVFSTVVQAGADGQGYYSLNIGSQLGNTTAAGTYATAVSYTVSNPINQDTGDVNNDGVLDILIGGTANGPSLLLGNADGTFGAASVVTVTGASNTLEARLVDLNNDGNLDLLTTTNIISTNNLLIRLGNGDGNFGATKTFDFGDQTIYQLAIADYNGDGNLDIAGGEFSVGTNFYTVLGNGDGTFTAKTTHSVGTNVRSIETQDFNLDGIDDLILTIGSGAASKVIVATGNGNGTFSTTYTMTTGDTYFAARAADLNRDGYMDFVAASGTPGSIGVFLGNGDGTFTQSNTQSGIAYNAFFLDANGDGLPDIGTQDITNDSMHLFIGNGDGTFSVSATLPLANLAFLGGGSEDFNSDGIDDLFTVSTTDGKVYILLGQSTESVSSPFFNLLDANDATDAIEKIGAIQDNLALEQGNIGAQQSRLEHSLAFVYDLQLNLEAGAAKILDLDIAAEAAELVRLQILQQANSALLAQANLNQSLVLELLRQN